jgi:hypothetical protein
VHGTSGVPSYQFKRENPRGATEQDIPGVYILAPTVTRRTLLTFNFSQFSLHLNNLLKNHWNATNVRKNLKLISGPLIWASVLYQWLQVVLLEGVYGATLLEVFPEVK